MTAPQTVADVLDAAADLLEKPGEPLDVCPRCAGSGVGVADTVCTLCNGSGGLDVIDLEALTYDELWDAIAAATRIDGGIIAISVVKFREAIRALRAAATSARQGENHVR